MALVTRKALFETFSPMVQIKRFRGKINIQRPRPPHFERAKYLALTKPYFLSMIKDKPISELCIGPKLKQKREEQENPFQNIIAGELRRWLTTSRLVAFYHINPMNSDLQFKAYVLFKKQNMHYKQYGKRTLEIAVKGTPYETILDFYVSQNMTVFSPDLQIKKLLQITKKFPQLILLCGIIDGKLVSKDDLMYYSSIPNIETAQAELVQTINRAGSQLVSNLNSHQTTLVSHLEQHANLLKEEK